MGTICYQCQSNVGYSYPCARIDQEGVRQAAVLLNANVAFLVLPAASHPQVEDSQQTPNISIAQVASQLSMVASIGSMIVGLLLVRQHRTRPVETAYDAVSPIYEKN